MSYQDYLAVRGYKRVTIERTTLTGAPTGHKVLTGNAVVQFPDRRERRG